MRYSWNLFQWRKIKTKSTESTQWRLLADFVSFISLSLSHTHTHMQMILPAFFVHFDVLVDYIWKAWDKRAKTWILQVNVFKCHFGFWIVVAHLTNKGINIQVCKSTIDIANLKKQNKKSFWNSGIGLSLINIRCN